VGIIHLKDVVRHELSNDPFDLGSLLRKCPFVPETLPIDSLMASFKRLHQHMAIVIDEHGSMVGLVTLEDLIEEVFGEVRDEFDSEEAEPIEVVRPGYLRANGRVLLDEIDEIVPVGEHDFDVETIGGLLLAMLSRRPQKGDEAQIGDLRLVAEQVTGLTIEQVGVYFDAAKAREASTH
jgi:CBS domain containing-hemolysin-like protein